MSNFSQFVGGDAKVGFGTMLPESNTLVTYDSKTFLKSGNFVLKDDLPNFPDQFVNYFNYEVPLGPKVNPILQPGVGNSFYFSYQANASGVNPSFAPRNSGRYNVETDKQGTVIMVPGEYYPSQGTQPFIFISRDYGQTWKTQKLPMVTPLYLGKISTNYNGFWVIVTSYSYSDTNAINTAPVQDGTAPYKSQIYISLDNGYTWRARVITNDQITGGTNAPFGLYDVACVPYSSTFYLTNHHYQSAGGYSAIRSTDYGQTFDIVGGTANTVDLTLGLTAAFYEQKNIAATGNAVYLSMFSAANSTPFIYKCLHSANTWTTFFSGGTGNSALYTIHYSLENDTLYFPYDGKIIFTTNGISTANTANIYNNDSRSVPFYHPASNTLCVRNAAAAVVTYTTNNNVWANTISSHTYGNFASLIRFVTVSNTKILAFDSNGYRISAFESLTANTCAYNIPYRGLANVFVINSNSSIFLTATSNTSTGKIVHVGYKKPSNTNDTAHLFSTNDIIFTIAPANTSFFVYSRNSSANSALVVYSSNTTSNAVVGNTSTWGIKYLNAFTKQAAAFDSPSVAAQETTSTGLSFKSDGTKMYVVGTTNDTVYQYSLSTPWSPNTATYDNLSYSVTTQDNTPGGIFFKPDGTKFYIVGQQNDTVYEYSMSSAWNVATASYTSNSYSVASQTTDPRGLFFSPDGTKMYTHGVTNQRVYEYTLSTPWNITTASHPTGANLSIGVASCYLGAFSNNGADLVVINDNNDHFRHYRITTPWSVNTGVLISSNLVTTDATLSAMFLDPTESLFYGIGQSNDKVGVWQLTSGTSLPFSNSDGVIVKDVDNKFIAASPAGIIAYSSNGTHWNGSTSNVAFATTSTLKLLDMSTSNVVFVANNTAVARSLDGGANFSNVSVNSSILSANLISISPSKQSNAWMFATSNNLFYSSNNGTDATALNIIVTRVEHVYGNTWAIVTGGKLLYTLNNGTSWYEPSVYPFTVCTDVRAVGNTLMLIQMPAALSTTNSYISYINSTVGMADAVNNLYLRIE